MPLHLILVMENFKYTVVNAEKSFLIYKFCGKVYVIWAKPLTILNKLRQL